MVHLAPASPPTRRAQPRRYAVPYTPDRVRPEGNRAKAAAAWRLARALRARHPGRRLRLVEAGGCADVYHVLLFCHAGDGQAETGEELLAMLNVGGSLHLVARADGRPLLAGISTVFSVVPWAQLCDAGGGEDGRRERCRARDLALTALAAVLGLS